jgi:hypothetical protein
VEIAHDRVGMNPAPGLAGGKSETETRTGNV